MVKELETPSSPGMEPLRVCIHTRDWIPGEMIPDQILHSIKRSRHTIIVLSKEYCKATWTMLEFKAVQEKFMKNKRKILTLVLHEELPHVEDLHPDIQNYLKLNMYIRRDDKEFWKKLISEVKRRG